MTRAHAETSERTNEREITATAPPDYCVSDGVLLCALARQAGDELQPVDLEALRIEGTHRLEKARERPISARLAPHVLTRAEVWRALAWSDSWLTRG